MPLSNAAFLISMSCLAVFLSQLGMMMYLPALPSIAQALNTTQDLTSLALPVYLAGMALPMLLWGKWGGSAGHQANHDGFAFTVQRQQRTVEPVHADRNLHFTAVCPGYGRQRPLGHGTIINRAAL